MSLSGKRDIGYTSRKPEKQNWMESSADDLYKQHYQAFENMRRAEYRKTGQQTVNYWLPQKFIQKYTCVRDFQWKEVWKELEKQFPTLGCFYVVSSELWSAGFHHCYKIGQTNSYTPERFGVYNGGGPCSVQFEFLCICTDYLTLEMMIKEQLRAFRIKNHEQSEWFGAPLEYILGHVLARLELDMSVWNEFYIPVYNIHRDASILAKSSPERIGEIHKRASEFERALNGESTSDGRKTSIFRSEQNKRLRLNPFHPGIFRDDVLTVQQQIFIALFQNRVLWPHQESLELIRINPELTIPNYLFQKINNNTQQSDSLPNDVTAFESMLNRVAELKQQESKLYPFDRLFFFAQEEDEDENNDEVDQQEQNQNQNAKHVVCQASEEAAVTTAVLDAAVSGPFAKLLKWTQREFNIPAVQAQTESMVLEPDPDWENTSLPPPDPHRPKYTMWTYYEEWVLIEAIRLWPENENLSYATLLQKYKTRFLPHRRPEDLSNKWKYLCLRKWQTIWQWDQIHPNKKTTVPDPTKPKRIRRHLSQLAATEKWVCGFGDCKCEYSKSSTYSINTHKHLHIDHNQMHAVNHGKSELIQQEQEEEVAGKSKSTPKAKMKSPQTKKKRGRPRAIAKSDNIQTTMVYAVATPSQKKRQRKTENPEQEYKEKFEYSGHRKPVTRSDTVAEPSQLFPSVAGRIIRTRSNQSINKRSLRNSTRA